MLPGCTRPRLDAARPVLPAGYGVPAVIPTGLAGAAQQPASCHAEAPAVQGGRPTVQAGGCSLSLHMAASQKLIWQLPGSNASAPTGAHAGAPPVKIPAAHRKPVFARCRGGSSRPMSHRQPHGDCKGAGNSGQQPHYIQDWIFQWHSLRCQVQRRYGSRSG